MGFPSLFLTFEQVMFLPLFLCYSDPESIIIKHSCGLTPANIYKFISTIKYPWCHVQGYLTGCYYWLQPWWSSQARDARKLQGHKVSFTIFINTNTIMDFPILFLKFSWIVIYLVLTYFIQNYDTKKLLTSKNRDSDI